MPRRALIVSGGWEGHQPKAIAEIFHRILTEENFHVDLSDSLDSFTDQKYLESLSLIVPNWTMGKITDPQLKSVLAAVESGVGLAGCHGGMCDAFRDAPEWQFATGGQWVAHPGNDRVTYTVHITDRAHEMTRGIEDFSLTSEQYYMHVDPANKILATTRFPIADGPHIPNGPIDMPVLWTKLFGRGRIFYCSIGHSPKDISTEPVLTLIRRGLLWSARA